jgi:hypothetical protein
MGISAAEKRQLDNSGRELARLCEESGHRYLDRAKAGGIAVALLLVLLLMGVDSVYKRIADKSPSTSFDLIWVVSSLVVAYGAFRFLEWKGYRLLSEAQRLTDLHGESEDGEPISEAEVKAFEGFSNEALGRAVVLLAEGKRWRDIYPSCIEGYAEMDPNTRRTRQQQFRYRTKALMVRAMKAGG